MPAANTAPYTIVAGVADVYVGAVGLAFPAVSVPRDSITTGGTWTPLGQTDGGVKVSHPQTIVELRTDNVTAPVKGVRSEEGLQVEFTLAETTPKNFAIALNRRKDITPTGVGDAGATGADKVINQYRGGFGVETMAMLVRGEHLSPQGDFNLQYELPAVYQSESPETDYVKDDFAKIHCVFTAIAPAAFTPGFTDDQIFGVLRVGAQ
jgi:hypothetical protein